MSAHALGLVWFYAESLVIVSNKTIAAVAIVQCVLYESISADPTAVIKEGGQKKSKGTLYVLFVASMLLPLICFIYFFPLYIRVQRLRHAILSADSLMLSVTLKGLLNVRRVHRFYMVSVSFSQQKQKNTATVRVTNFIHWFLFFFFLFRPKKIIAFDNLIFFYICAYGNTCCTVKWI